MVGENEEEEEEETVTGKVLGAFSSRLFRRHPLGAKPQDEGEERRKEEVEPRREPLETAK